MDGKNRIENRPNCLNCGKAHTGICLKGSTGCYGCGELGHIRKNCPKNVLVGHGDQQKGNNKTGNTGQGQRQGRAYAIFPGDT